MLQDHHDTSLSVLRHQLAPDEMEAKGADAPMAIGGPALQLSDTGDFFSKASFGNAFDRERNFNFLKGAALPGANLRLLLRYLGRFQVLAAAPPL